MTHPAIEVALRCLKTPFAHQGRVPGLGMDCAGLFIQVCRELGLEHQDAAGYPRNPYDGKLEAELDGQPCLRRIDPGEAKEGDLLCMRIRRAPQHIGFHAGFVDGQPYIIHASEEHGGVVHHRIDALWGARVMRVYRLEGIA